MDNHRFSNLILSWFTENARDLPWRRNYDPYCIWISEIILQQTQMDRGVDYFNRWIEKYPDLKSLARAGEDEVLKQWEGLGYYSRARNLLKTAKILADRDGLLPARHDELLQLPGIGPYTAGAILSLAFNQDYPIVDANIERLFSRIFNIATPIKQPENKKFIWQKARELIPPGNARQFNQGLMELGALICLPRNPQCGICPVVSFCKAHQAGIVLERPVSGSSSGTIAVNMVTGVLQHNGEYFIQKRPATGVWANLWEFPGGRIEKGESRREALQREYREETEFSIQVGKKITTILHSYTRYRVTLHCYFCHLGENRPLPVLHAAGEYRWVSFKELNNFAFPSPHRQLIGLLQKATTGTEKSQNQ